MKTIVLILAIATLSNCLAQTKKPLKFKLTQVQAYCGGVHPSPEMEAELKKPMPYANKTLIRVSDKNKVDTITTDANGYIIAPTKIGKYNYFEPWKYFKQIPNNEPESNIKMDCIKSQWACPDLVLTVAKKTTLVNNIEYQKCPHSFPCLIKRNYPQ
jgi:hypothetical protein